MVQAVKRVFRVNNVLLFNFWLLFFLLLICIGRLNFNRLLVDDLPAVGVQIRGLTNLGQLLENVDFFHFHLLLLHFYAGQVQVQVCEDVAPGVVQQRFYLPN